MPCTGIQKKYSATIKTNNDTNRKVILVKQGSKLWKPLITHFDRISLRWNKWCKISEQSAGHI